MEDAPEAAPDAGPLVRAGLIRLGALLLVTVALFVAAKVTGLSAHFKPDEVHARMAAAGWWAPLAYLVAFTAGELVHIPGTLFVAAAVLAYGRIAGTALAFLGAIVSFSVSFAVVRAVGGKPLGAIRWPFFRRVLAHLDDHPVRTVILLRLVLWLTPQLNYALALSNVRFKSYLVGSVIGLAAPIVLVSLGLDYLLH